MNRSVIITIVILLTGYSIRSQDLITLNTCYENAVINHPQADEKQLHKNLWQLKQDNLSASWYPGIEAGANVLYNSNVADLSDTFESIPVPGLAENAPVMPHDQYRLTIDINQVIYDGGAIKGRRKLEDANYKLSEQEVETELYKVREAVNNYYFAFILLKNQKTLLNTYLLTLTEQILAVESGIRNGVLLPSDRDVLRAEKIRLEQQIKDIEIRVNSTAAVLSDLTGMNISHETEAALPETLISRDKKLSRPELYMLELQQQQIEAGKDLVKSERRPKAFAFATLGYGKPAGNDFFSDSFGPYYVVGAGIKWNIIDWNKSRRKEQIIDINKSIIDSQKEKLKDNLSRLLEMKYAEIRSLEESLSSDRELISTLKSVRKTARSQYNNGTITASEYLSEWNKQKQAEINLEIHSVNLARARIEYLNIAGLTIE
ncbi:MAG: TolC family protein [Bacteroidales bacterium]|nr:TolC family protein [Bacteroidales bacterium]